MVRILTTDANGRCRTANKALPYGTYQVYELRSDATIKAGEAYNGSDKLGSSDLANNTGYMFKNQNKTVSITTDGQVEEVSFTDTIVKGGVKFKKTDLEREESKAQGDATLKGCIIEIGNEYKFQGKLWDKTNNRYVADEEGNPVTSWSDVITAKAKNGYLYMKFELPGSYINETEKVVVFESLFEIEMGREDVSDKDVPITEHIDPNDIDQSLPVDKPLNDPKIGTLFTDDEGNKTVEAGEVVLVDEISFEGLEEGRYVVKGYLMDKATSKPLTVDEKEITSTKEFDVEASKGIVDISFEFNAESLSQKSLVAFEEIWQVTTDEIGNRNEVLICEHKDLNSVEQTVDITTPEQPTTPEEPSTPEETTTHEEPSTPEETTTQERTTPKETTTPKNPTTKQSPTKPANKTTPKTGDSLEFTSWIIGILIALMIGVTCAVAILRKRTDES